MPASPTINISVARLVQKGGRKKGCKIKIIRTTAEKKYLKDELA
jgi:hypothetical protein